MNSHKIKEKWILLKTGRAANHFKFRARIYRKLAIFDSVFTQYFIFTRFIFFNTFCVGDLHFPALSIDTNNGNIRGHIESGHNCQKVQNGHYGMIGYGRDRNRKTTSNELGVDFIGISVLKYEKCLIKRRHKKILENKIGNTHDYVMICLLKQYLHKNWNLFGFSYISTNL